MRDSSPDKQATDKVALVLSGGVSLGAYEAGAYEALHEAGTEPNWIASASVGSVNAAIIAGNPVGTRVERLRAFWSAITHEPMPITSTMFGTPAHGMLRTFYNGLSAFQTLLFGNPAAFRPRYIPGPRAGSNEVTALYDFGPHRRRSCSSASGRPWMRRGR